MGGAKWLLHRNQLREAYDAYAVVLSPHIAVLMQLPLSEREQVRVAFIGNGHHKEQRHIYVHVPNTERFSSNRTKGNIRAVKVVHRSPGQHGIIFELGFALGWAVTSDDED